MTEKQINTVLDINDIMHFIPHRYPFLLIDKIKDVIVDESATGIKCVSMNEPFFQGHFPNHPVMPGVLIIEAFAQTAGALSAYSIRQKNISIENPMAYFMSVEDAKFRKPVVPGDVLELKVTKQKERGNVFKYKGQAFVDGKVVSEATFTIMVMDAQK
ncbi:MAG: 3-hydroxyacyl-[acyl-carrier-protein] dehydratase FabZ [Holosporales bacterium]